MAKQLTELNFKLAFRSTTAQTQNLVLKAAKGKDNTDFPKIFANYKWESAKPYDMALIIIAYYTYCMKSSNQSIKKFGFTARNTNHYSFKLLNNLIKGNGAKVKALMQLYFQIPMNKILESVIPGTNDESINARSVIIANFVKQAVKITPSSFDENETQNLKELIYTLTDNKKAELTEELENVGLNTENEQTALEATRTAAKAIIKKQQYGEAALDAANKTRIKPLRRAIKSNDSNSVRTIIENNPKILKLPLENNGFTALHVAVKYGSTDVVRLLLQQPSIDPNINVQEENLFPLWQAASYFNGDNNSAEITRLLLDHPKIDPNIQDSTYRRTALNQAASWANINVIQLLLPRTNDPNTPDRDGNTPLHNVCKSIAHEDRYNAINQLLQNRRINPNIQNNGGNTALHLAAMSGNQDIINLLLAHGANINVQNQNGDTPLHIAAHYNKQDAIEVLLNHHANTGIFNNRGQTYQDLLPQPPRHIQVEDFPQAEFRRSLNGEKKQCPVCLEECEANDLCCIFDCQHSENYPFGHYLCNACAQILLDKYGQHTKCYLCHRPLRRHH